MMETMLWKSNHNEMISTTAPMTRANSRVQEPRGVDTSLDPEHGET
jgi:hypothetical protein